MIYQQSFYYWEISYKNSQQEEIINKTKKFTLRDMESSWINEEKDYLINKCENTPIVKLVKL